MQCVACSSTTLDRHLLVLSYSFCTCTAFHLFMQDDVSEPVDMLMLISAHTGSEADLGLLVLLLHDSIHSTVSHRQLEL